MNYDHHFRKAMLMLEAAKPASGFRPETPKEWNKLLRAHEEMVFASLCQAGMQNKQARALAKQFFCSPVGRMLLDSAFSEAAHAKPKNHE